MGYVSLPGVMANLIPPSSALSECRTFPGMACSELEFAIRSLGFPVSYDEVQDLFRTSARKRFRRHDTVDGSNPAITTWAVYNLVNNGINYQPQLVSRISSINSTNTRAATLQQAPPQGISDISLKSRVIRSEVLLVIYFISMERIAKQEICSITSINHR